MALISYHSSPQIVYTYIVISYLSSSTFESLNTLLNTTNFIPGIVLEPGLGRIRVWVIQSHASCDEKCELFIGQPVLSPEKKRRYNKHVMVQFSLVKIIREAAS